MPDALASPQDSESDRAPGRLVRAVAVLVGACALVGVAALMVGPAPKPADEGFPDAPPPLALPGEVAEGSELARAAARLAAGELDAARAGFTDVVAEDRDSEAGQVGLVLSRWRTTGPISVERDLGQLAREYPDSAFVALHLALVQGLLGEPRASRSSLREAVALGRDAADETSLRMARIADDLLHPDAFRGDMPVLVAPAEVRAQDRATHREMVAAVGRGDRNAATARAAKLSRSTDALSRVAAIVAGFDKGEPQPTIERLDAIAAAPGTDPAARDRARMLAALADAWSGGDRASACARLRESAGAGVDAGTRRLAGPIAAELCP